jgi:DNA-binding IclR family transcriptional regulator
LRCSTQPTLASRPARSRSTPWRQPGGSVSISNTHSISEHTAPTRPQQSQTLDRGLTALELIALATRPPSIDEIARHLDVHRSIAYRIVRTLEDHRLVRRDGDGRCVPAERLAALGGNVRVPLRTAALPELTVMAEDLRMTAFLVVREGDEAVTVESVEPRTTAAHVAYRPGNRHPVDRGAPGIALLAGGPANPGERPEVADARRRGWATSRGEVIAGVAAVASWIDGPDGLAGAVACIYPAGAEVEAHVLAQRVRAGATAIAHALGGT